MDPETSHRRTSRTLRRRRARKRRSRMSPRVRFARSVRRRSTRPLRRTGRRRRLIRRARRLAIRTVSRNTSSSWSAAKVEKSWVITASRSETPGTPRGSSLSSPDRRPRNRARGSPAGPSPPASTRWPVSIDGVASSNPGQRLIVLVSWRRQNHSKDRSKAGKSSGRPTKTARRPRYSSPRSATSRRSSARTASVTWMRVMGSPCWRSMAPKRTTAAPRSRRAISVAQVRRAPVRSSRPRP